MKFIVILSMGLCASLWFVSGLAEPLLDGAAYAQSLAPTTQKAGQLTNSNQHSEQLLPPQQKEVWNGEQNYFQYLQAKDLKSFMSLWDDNFVGWPDYSDHPLRKPDIESGVAAEFQSTPTSPQMERLIHALAGEWATEETYEPSDLVPKGGTGHSRDSYRVGPARLSLIEEYHAEGAGGKSWGIGTIWWDAEAQGFHFVWCDSFALDKGCRVSSQLGKWIGNDYVATDVHEVSGKQVFEKEVWSDFTPNSFSQTLYTGDASDKLKRFLTIKAKRIIKRQP
jgi:hypothetical protein